MSKTMLSRLAMLEVLDASGPVTITELARRSGLDIAVVSRTISAAETAGWVSRRDNRISIGPRAALLGHTTEFAETIGAATRLSQAVATVTGLTVNALGLIGHDAVVFAAAAGLAPAAASGLATKSPLHATAGGIAIAIQLTPGELNRALPREPYPEAAQVIAKILGTSAEEVLSAGARLPEAGTPAALPRSRAELEARMEQARRTGWAFDAGGLDPTINCIAVPWPLTVMPAALCCLGTPGAIAAGRDAALRALSAATAPGATAQTVLSAPRSDGAVTAGV
jgi:DNA-binding IclR family transcriptional regulator